MGGGLPVGLGHRFCRTIAIVPSDAGGSLDGWAQVPEWN